MRHLRLALPALALVAVGTWASQGMACDQSKTSARTAAAKKSATCSAQMAAQCTPEMAAACAAEGMSAATTASATSCASKTSAVTASASDHCSAAKISAAAYAASSSACAAKTSAVTASSAGASCEAHGKAKVSASAAGSSCSGRGMTTAAGKSAHADCDACSDMALCYEELEAAGTRTQVVPLKNGVMFVYTAESPGRVSAVQSAMARRNDRLGQIVTAGDKAHLCPECKTIRGAMASGKMTREVVNIEGGALTLMTSSDPSVVAKIHAMVENHKGSRSKI